MKNNILEEGRRPMGTPFFGRKKLVRKIKNHYMKLLKSNDKNDEKQENV